MMKTQVQQNLDFTNNDCTFLLETPDVRFREQAQTLELIFGRLKQFEAEMAFSYHEITELRRLNPQITELETQQRKATKFSVAAVSWQAHFVARLVELVEQLLAQFSQDV